MLMIPGPADALPEALAQMAEPVMPHYGDDYLAIHARVLDGLREFFGTDGTVIMIPGPGTAGTEMAVCGLATAKTIVVEAGMFAHRITEIIESYGGEVVPLPVPDRQAVEPEAVRAMIESTPGLGAIAMVHNESSTGIIHPLREIGALARAHDLLFAVDAVSSLAGARIDMDANAIDIAWSASQKALSAPAGLAFVALNERALACLERRRDRICGFTLNPLIWKWHIDNWAWHPYPTSMPTGVVRGLDVTLRQALREGLDVRCARHRRAAAAIRRAATELGFQVFAVDVDAASPTISALLPPPGVDEAALRDSMLHDAGVWIAGGYGPLRGTIIRIGHMGAGATRSAVAQTATALEGALAQQRQELEPGAAAVAVEAVYAESGR